MWFGKSPILLTFAIKSQIIVSYLFACRLLFVMSVLLVWGCSSAGSSEEDSPAPSTIGVIVVYASNHAASAFAPLGVFIGSDSVGRLTINQGRAPRSSFTAGVLRLERPAGSYRIRATSRYRLQFLQDVTIAAGDTVYVPLSAEGLGFLQIGLDINLPASALPMVFVLNQSDTIGRITANTRAQGFQCDNTSSLTAARPFGNYAWRAIGASGCQASGLIQLEPSAECKAIAITTCQ